MEDPAEDICYHFAMTDATRGDLEEYLWRYPAQAGDLIDMWFELDRMARQPEPAELTTEERAEFDAATDRALVQLRRQSIELEAERKLLN